MPKSTAQSLRDEIAELKEQRSQTILRYAQDDDSTTGADHPDVLALEEQITAKQNELRTDHPETLVLQDDPAELLGLRRQQADEAQAFLATAPSDHPNRPYFERMLKLWQADIARLS